MTEPLVGGHPAQTQAPDGALQITGGEAIARMLMAFGSGPVFGMGGFQLLPFYDAAGRLGMSHHLVNDERTAVFAADAFSKVTGRVGLVDATLGPGATNLVTGLVESLNAGTPIVAIVGDSHRDHSGKNMTQECHQVEILRPASKEIIQVPSAGRIPELVRRAFAVATAGRPGPVVVDVPEDVSHDVVALRPDAFHAPRTLQQVPAHRTRPEAEAVRRAAQLLIGARRPIILAGGGVHLSGGSRALTEFSRTLNIPVAHTLTGKGAIACRDPLSAGLFGRYDRIANAMLDEADVVFAVGCKLGEIATKRYALPLADKTLIHLDIVAEEFHRTATPDVALWGDVRSGLEDLQGELRADAEAVHARLDGYASEVSRRMQAWREGVADRLHSSETPINVARVVTEVNEVLPEDGYLIADGGFAAHWAGLLFDTKRAGRTFVPDRGFASIGYGLPGAIGVSSGMPGRAVVSMTGDAGLNMSLGDLETARRLGLSFTVVVINNAASGYVKALQHLVYGEHAYYASDLAEMDYAAVARSMGCNGIRVEHADTLADALRAGLSEPGPTLVDVVCTRDPAKMLPGVDNRAAQYRMGDRIV